MRVDGLIKIISSYITGWYSSFEDLKTDIKSYKLTKVEIDFMLKALFFVAMQHPPRFSKVLEVLDVSEDEISKFYVDFTSKMKFQTLIDVFSRSMRESNNLNQDVREEIGKWFIFLAKNNENVKEVFIHLFDINSSYIVYFMNNYMKEFLDTVVGKDKTKNQVFNEYINILTASYALNERQTKNFRIRLKKVGFTLQKLLKETETSTRLADARSAIARGFYYFGIMSKNLGTTKDTLEKLLIRMCSKEYPLQDSFSNPRSVFFSILLWDAALPNRYKRGCMSTIKKICAIPNVINLVKKDFAQLNLSEVGYIFKYKQFMNMFPELRNTDVYRMVEGLVLDHEKEEQKREENLLARSAKYRNKKKSIYGYHRTTSKLVTKAIKKAGFKAGYGATYGVGIYFTYSIHSQMNQDMIDNYGPVIIRVLINLDNYVIFDKDMGEKVYGKGYTAKQHIKDIFDVDIEQPDNEMYSSDTAKKVVNQLRDQNFTKVVSGIMFTGRHDGSVIVAYRYNGLKVESQVYSNDTDKRHAKWIKDNLKLIEEARVK